MDPDVVLLDLAMFWGQDLEINRVPPINNRLPQSFLTEITCKKLNFLEMLKSKEIL